jgi:hypothetical protein
LKKRSSFSATSFDDNALAKYRVELFMSDTITNINATLGLIPNFNVAAKALELAAQKRIEAELLAFDNAFDHPTTGTT